MEPILIDGATGEGGGQVVRIAVALAALTSKPIQIINIRGNRPRPGLKTQHFTAIRWLADITDAQVEGLRVGSKTLTFIARRPPTELMQRNIKISPTSTSAASTLLVLQTILPFLLFAADEDDTPIRLTIRGGTNTSFAPSFEYVDHVLLPTLEDRFGVKVERNRPKRGWSIGPSHMGCIGLTIHPLPRGEMLLFKPPVRPPNLSNPHITKLDVIMIFSDEWAALLEKDVRKELKFLFPGANTLVELQTSRHMRWQVLLVAHSQDGRRWGKDVLFSPPKKCPDLGSFISKTCRTLCRELEEEVSLGGEADMHLQDQIVCFQALCQGLSSFPRHDAREDAQRPGDPLASSIEALSIDVEGLVEDDARQPFGHGSLHTRTARWVAKCILPEVKFYNNGDVVQGVGMKFT